MANKVSKLNGIFLLQFLKKLTPIIHILVVLSIIGSTLSSFVDSASAQVLRDDPEQAISAIAEEPFRQSPVRNRKSTYDFLIQIAESVPGTKLNNATLPTELVERILADNESFFIDEGRIFDVQVLEHDWELSKHLVNIIKDKKVGDSEKDIALDGLLYLLRADKQISALAYQDAVVTISSCEGSNPPKKSECNQAAAHLQTAEILYQNGIDALNRGDADSAVHHLQKSWSFSYQILALWDVSYEGDLDGDGLINLLELRLGSDIFAPDSDGDGLSDSFEFFKIFPFCLTTQADTDQNGTLDGLEDLDNDGLTNHQESDHGTMPLRADTDGDTLGDLFEIQTTGVNPLLADSDLDGLNDDSELRLGSDPASPDTDSDGIPDSDEIYAQVLQDLDMGITIEIEGVGDYSNSFQAHSLAGVAGLEDLPGLIGDFISFSAEAAAGGSVRLRFDPSQVPNQDFTNLRIVSYNPGTGELSILPDQAVNLVASEVIASFDSYSPVAIVYIPNSSLSSLGFDGFAGRLATQNETQRVILTSRPVASLSFPTIQNIDYQRENNDPTPTPEPTQLPDVIPTPTPAEEIEGKEEESDPGEDPPIKIPLVETGDDFPALSRQMESFAKSADGEKIIIGDAAEIEHTPAVVYNPNTQRYLVVWVKDSDPAGIYGRYLTEEGQPDGAAFLLTNESVDTPSRLELQYNSVENTYLLAWQELNGQTSVESYYYGQIVYTIPKANLYTLLINSEGEPIGTAPNLITSELTDLDGRFEFDIVFNSTNNQYLIAWVQPRGQIIYRVVHPHRLIAQVLGANGVPSGNQQVIQPGVASDVRLEYSPESHKYLLTYSYFYPSNIEYEVSGLLLNADTLTISRYIAITNMRTGWQMLPQITFNPSDDVFFGSWYDSPEYSTGGLVHFRSQMFRASNGLQVGGSFVVMESSEGIFSEMPGAGYSPIEDRYLVLGAYGGSPTLQGQYVLPDRSLDGDPFLLDDSAIQNTLAARLGEGEELPTWLSVWTHQGDIHGQVLSGAPVGDLDSDLDGLTDAEEIAGFVNQFGKLITTSPDRADTDADGIPDGKEIGTKSGNVYNMVSDPTLPDTDSDDVEDFVELYALPYPTLPRDPDTDGDGLNDGEEVNIYSTDPLLMDTDGDDQNDGEEIAIDSDPLLFDTIMSPLDTASQFAVGAVCGDLCIDNPDYGTIPFLVGLVVSGAISVIPLGVTQVIGGIADVRDLFAAIIRKDPAGIIVLGLTLIPYLGDPADFIGTVGRFVGRYPKLAGEAAVVLIRLDFVWKNLDEAGQLKIMKKFWSDEVIEAMLSRGFETSRIVDLVYAGVDVRHLASALDEVVDQFPGLIKFLKETPLEGPGILKGNGLTANLKKLADAEKMGNARAVNAAISNIKGAYTQVVMKAERYLEGVELLQNLRHVNANGYDLVLRESGIIRVLEAKSGAKITLREITNYIDKVNGEVFFNADYFRKWIYPLLGETATENILKAGAIEVEFFLNNPRSAELAQELLDLIGGTTAKYRDKDGIVHTINLIISHVLK